MHRIDGPGATADNKFTEGDPVGGVQATVVTDDFLNDVQEELMSILVAAGVNPVKGTQDQVLKSITALAFTQKFTAYTATGSAGSFALAPDRALTGYAVNQRFQVTFGAAGGATPTLNVSSLGPKNLKQYSSSGAKVPAVIASGQTSDVFYDGTDWVLLVSGMPLGTGGIGSTLNTATASDTNAALAGGMHSLAGTANAPFANGMLLRGIYNGAQSWTQIATSIDNAGMFWQGSINGTINPWRQVWDSVSFNPASKVNATNVANAGFVNSTTDTPFMTHSNGTTVSLAKKNTALLSANGWHKDTDTGVITQWGWANVGDDQILDVTLPVAFPNAFTSASATAQTSTPTTSLGTWAGTAFRKSNSVISVGANSSSGAGVTPGGVCWLAIGY